MMNIEIDFDVYKELTSRRATEGVTYNDVLREVLGLGPRQGSQVANASGAWTTKGVTFPEGSEFRAHYKGREITGKVVSGALVVDGERYFSPSAAAVAITGFSINGWRFWTCRLPGHPSFVSLEGLRK